MNKIEAIKMRAYAAKVERLAHPLNSCPNYETTAELYEHGCYKYIGRDGGVSFVVSEDVFAEMAEALNMLSAAYDIMNNYTLRERLTEPQQMFMTYFAKFSRPAAISKELLNVYPSFDNRKTRQ